MNENHHGEETRLVMANEESPMSRLALNETDVASGSNIEPQLCLFGLLTVHRFYVLLCPF